MILRGFQEKIAQEIDNRFNGIGREARRFVGAKVPTGGGKSFLFMDQLEKFMDKHEPKEGCLSDVCARFYAPLTGIVTQTKNNVVKYIVFERYINEFKEKHNIEGEIENKDIFLAIQEISTRLLSSAGIKGKKADKIIGNLNKVETEDDLRNILQKVFESLKKSNRENILQTELPNVKFVCYQSDNEEEILEEESDIEPELIVFDEAHRASYKNSWGKLAKALIRKYKNCKFLSITATPERDIDGIDPMMELADICGYSISELRNGDYLAADMTLVDALTQDPPLVTKPDVISFDCMLDATKEYEEMKELINKQEKKKNNVITRTKDKFISEYPILIMNFLTMCKLSGKFDFLIENLQGNEKLVDVLTKFINGENVVEYFTELKEIKEKVYEMDNPKTEIGSRYAVWREDRVAEIYEKVINDPKRQYLKKGKHICLAPVASSQTKTKSIMQKYKDKIKRFLNIDNEDVMITHSNTKVISAKEDEENLERFIVGRTDSKENPLVMVAVNKFNEGLHVAGVMAETMFRQIIDIVNPDKEEQKEEPRTTFLQLIGRCISSIDPKNPPKDKAVIFDVACNFMRYNEKLNNIFEISKNQQEFKKIYDESKQIYKGKSDEIVEIPKVTILDRIIGVMQALYENGIDTSNINVETKFEDLDIPEDKKEKVLDDIFAITRTKLKPDYKIGLKLTAARDAFWHREKENKSSGSKKLQYNKATDAFFERVSFEELYRIGFFRDLENKRDSNLINSDGFIIANCSNLDNFYGYNIYTGTKYTNGIPEHNIPGVDIDNFTKEGIHKLTGLRFNSRFFRFDHKTNNWINLHTGKDEDLLGYNHEGIMINSAKGRVRI